MGKIDGQVFTITKVDRKDYDETPGVVITTKEVFPIEGEPFSKFHTTRKALVGKLLNVTYANGVATVGALTSLAIAINDGGELKVKTVSKPTQDGKYSYFDFEQC